ncbi:hypothetical protein EIK77_009994 [Talaromyces pinophilus]|nr:hypothetical protein EIK77_009994 [Talaromyces pinophilus]
MCGADIFLAVLAVFFPPIAGRFSHVPVNPFIAAMRFFSSLKSLANYLLVWIKVGLCTADSIINIALCCLGYIPGLLHAWYIIMKYPDSEEYPEGYERVDGNGRDVENGRRVTYYYVSHQATVPPQSDRRYGATDNTSAPHVPSQTRPGNSSAAPNESPSSAHPPTYAEAVKGDHKVQTQD